MDPMDYVLHNHSRPTAHYDPVHSASGSWVPNPHPTGIYPWQDHGPAVPQSYPHHPLQPAPAPGSDPFQLAPNGGLPHPNPNYHAGLLPASFAGAEAPRHYHHSHSPLRMSGPPVGLPGPTDRPGPGDHENDGAFVNQVPGGRPLSFHQPGGLGVPPAGNNSEPNSLPRPPFPLSDLPTNTFAHQHRHFAVPLPPPLSGPFNSTQSRRGHVSSSSTPSRSFREAPSPATGPSQPSSTSRRSHPRTRRSMSSRFMASDPHREDDDDELGRQLFLDHFMHGTVRSEPEIPDHVVDDALVRQLQLVRGAVSSKMVASKMTIRSLQTVDIVDLPEAERTCVICYNEYGIETPEGINEAPLRLPKCKHVFGDHCIKKWFEDSDSCPYCRDKLHSEPKQHGTSARAFMNMMRLRGVAVPPGLTSNTDESLVRAMSMTTAPVDAESGRSGSRQTSSGGRRSPPDDANEQRRRTRPRHSMSNHPERATTTFTRPPVYIGPSPTDPTIPGSGNVPGSVSTHPSQGNSAPHPSQSEARRGWQAVGTLAGELFELSRRPGLAQPSNSMSPSAPTFYPRGVLGNHPGLDFLTTAAEQEEEQQQQSSSSLSTPRLPNPLQSIDGVGQEEQQDNAISSASQLHLANTNTNTQGDSGEAGQGSPDQTNRTRLW